MSDAKPYPKWLFGLLATTFLWGFLITNLAFKKIAGWNEWATLCAYPVVCWTAAALLLRARRTGNLVFSVLHLVIGIAWIFLALWVAREFGRHFWK